MDINTTKERPILFSGEMVRAIIDGRKTQTRRVWKLPKWADWDGTNGEAEGQLISKDPEDKGWYAVDEIECPYGRPGDRLWVREKFQPLFADGVENHSQANWKTGKGYEISYPATDGIQEYFDQDDNLKSACKPSIHMPRWASRILLEITDVRVERLNEISAADCIAEGLRKFPHKADFAYAWRENDTHGHGSATGAYRNLWESINGPGSWDKNPWVWVVEFKVLEGGAA